MADAGAISLGDSLAGTRGAVVALNSVLGSVAGGGDALNFSYDPIYHRLVVGCPAANRVSLFTYAVMLTPLNFTNGGFQFNVSGPTGPNYVIMASSNLTNWNDLATNIAPTLPFQFTDAGAGATDRRFYRVRLQQ